MLYLLLTIMVFVASRGAYAYYLHKDTASTTGDAMNHLMFVQEYYRNKGRACDLSYMYLLDKSDYPTGFHKLFYYLRIPVTWLESNGGYLPMLFDLAHLVLIFVAMRMHGGENYEWLLGFVFLRILWGNEGRAAHFSERAYGVFWGSAYLFCTVTAYLNADMWWLLGSVLTFTVLSISSKFAWQAVAFFSIGLCVSTMDLFFFHVLLLAFLFAALATKGYSMKVLKGILRHSKFYREHLSPRNPILRRNYVELLNMSIGLKSYLHVVMTNSPLRLVTDAPISLAVVYIALIEHNFDIWAQWFFIGCLIVLLISTKPLKFLGEPERYLEFFLLPAFVFLSGYSFFDRPIVSLLCILIFLLVISHQVIYKTATHKDTLKKKEQKEIRALGEYFNEIQDELILTIPFRISYFLGYRNKNNRFLAIFANVGESDKEREFRWLLKDRYPFVRGDLESVTKRFGLNYIVAHKPSVRMMNDTYGGRYYDFNSYKVIYENDVYVVYEVSSA